MGRSESVCRGFEDFHFSCCDVLWELIYPKILIYKKQQYKQHI